MPLIRGHKLEGVSHKNSGSDVGCQDAFAFDETSEAMISAIADGVGSEKHSAFGSKTASETVVSFCAKNIQNGMKGDEVLRVIYQGFDEAWRAVEKGAREQNFDVRQCNTTLTVAVFIDGEVYYGHAGDSGIFAFFEDGLIEPVTTQQNDSAGRVYTLSSGPNKWEFNKTAKKAVSLLLCTDGIWNMFFPPRLAEESEKHSVPLLAWYIDPEAIKVHSKQKGFQEWLEADMEGININNSSDVGFDDITIVIMYNDRVQHERQADSYYEPPTEEELEKAKKAEHKRLYGHLEDVNDKSKVTSDKTSTIANQSVENANKEREIKPVKTSMRLIVEKPLKEVCIHDKSYWLSITERIEIAIIIFVKLERISRNSPKLYPLDIFVILDDSSRKLNVRFGDEHCESSETYYRIIRQVAMLLTNGLALMSPRDKKDFSAEDKILTKKLYDLFWKSYIHQSSKDENAAFLPHPDIWLEAIRNFLSLQKPCYCRKPTHFALEHLLKNCPWCKLE